MKILSSCIAGALLLAASPVFSAEINVPADQPTIQAAVNAASSGDIIRVAPGNYVGSLQFNGKNLRLESTGGPEVTTIRSNGGTTIDIGPGAALIGFTVTGGMDAFGAGMDVHGTGTHIRGNIFEGNVQSAGGYGAAIGINSASPVIERNVFRNNSAGGDTQFLTGVISLINYSSPRIINNLFYDNDCRALNITVTSGNAPEVINNTIVRNPVGIRVDARVSTGTHIYRNNLIAGNGTGLQVDFLYGTNAPTWDHNLLYGNAANYTGISDLTGVNGNIVADPGFAYATTTDFRLPQTSPAIDVGSNASAPSEDYKGTARPLDGNGDGTAIADIGAHESPAIDTQGPQITVSATRQRKKRDNVPVVVRGKVVDSVSGVASNSATYAVQDEYGVVQPSGQITLLTDGTYEFTVILRPARKNDRNGRVYQITVQARDNAGNVGTQTVAVTI
jgi:hypothetical protein